MDTLTPGETSISRRDVGGALLAGAVLVALTVAGLHSPTYARIVAALLVAFGATFAARTLVSVAVATSTRSAPDPEPNPAPVSVLVTAYNEVDVLPETVEACLDLDYPADRLEVLVGYETASTDGTAAEAESLAAAHPRVRAVPRERPPAGKAAATNALLAHATGEVLAVLDADQRPEPDALRRAVGWLDGDGGGDAGKTDDGSDTGDTDDGSGAAGDDVWCVKGRCFGVNPRASPVALCATVERAVAERVEFYARDRLGGFTLFTGGQAFFRADALDRVGPFDESVLLEDLDMAYRLARAGGAVRVDPGIVTREENPTTLRAWWHQRVRWARGGMQVARRYLGRGLLSGPPSAGARADFAGTLSALLVLPALALAAPGAALGVALHGTGLPPSLAPVGTALVAATLLTPAAAVYATFALDARDGYRHDRSEYAAPLLLWPYFAVQCGAIVAAFLAEFALGARAVYVTSATDDSEE